MKNEGKITETGILILFPLNLILIELIRLRISGIFNVFSLFFNFSFPFLSIYNVINYRINEKRMNSYLIYWKELKSKRITRKNQIINYLYLNIVKCVIL